MTLKIPDDEREQVRADLVDTANRLIKKYKLTLAEARQFIREMLTVSI